MSDPGFASPIRFEGGTAIFGDDSKFDIEFISEPVYQQFLSEGGPTADAFLASGTSLPQKTAEGAGYRIYKNEDFIIFRQPGAKWDFKRKVKLQSDHQGPSDPERFPRQWAAFKAQQEQVSDGTPLEMWPQMDRATALSFKSVRIHTIQQLSNLADTNMGTVPVMDARKWRDLALKFLERAKNEAPTAAVSAELAELRATVASLQTELSNKPKRGRPPKQETENAPGP